MRERSSELESIAQELLQKEVIFKEDVVRLIGERPFGEPSTEESTPSPVENGQPEAPATEASTAVDSVENEEE